MTDNGKNSPVKRGGRFVEWVRELVQTLFVTLLTTYLLLLLLETIFKSSVSSHMNLNYLLLIVVVVGIVAVLTTPRKVERVAREQLTPRTFIVIVCAAIGGAAIIWYKTKEMGWLSWVISAVGVGMIVLLSLLVWQGDQDEENKSGSGQDN
ncbi:unnamed protein product, partial [marine sediment metagenome]